jgi:D-sedoheptulose 7-phosphate isomerase
MDSVLPMKSHITNSLKEAQHLLNSVLEDFELMSRVDQAIDLLIETYKNDRHVFSCGNGGSLCDSMHFAEELTGRYRKNRRSLPALSIADPSHLTCTANDFGYKDVFGRYLDGWAKPGDTLLAISTSGNSKNIIEAVQAAKQKGAKSIGLLGKTGGVLKDIVDIPIIVPSLITDRIQEIHIKLIHIFIEGIERELFPENYTD